MDEAGCEIDINPGIMADSEALILVDEADRRLGHLSKDLCHEGRGILHRAFSLLIFNDRGELLLQQRAPSKRLWPLYWSNSCCSHPRRSETMDVATRRRLYEELGIRCELQFLFKFRYQAQFDATGAEHELCSVFIGRCHEPPRINRDEIADLGAGSARMPCRRRCRAPTVRSTRPGLCSNGRGSGGIIAQRCSLCTVD